MKTKRIEYSYPTSPNAERFHFPRGCWTVELVNGFSPGLAVAAFSTIEEAEKYAAHRPEEWNRLTRRAPVVLDESALENDPFDRADETEEDRRERIADEKGDHDMDLARSEGDA